MRKIKRDSSFEDLVKHFTTGDNPLFKEIWRFVLFSSALGHHLEEKGKIEKADLGKAMPESYFANCPTWPGFLYLIGICETESAEVLKATDESEDILVGAFEGFAVRGMMEIKESFARFHDPLEAVLDLISRLSSPDDKGTKPIDFSDLLQV
jgi:dnd system-associated protein 4